MYKKHRSKILLSSNGDKKADQHHPKSPYKNNPPNFVQLASLYPDIFGQFVKLKKYLGGESADADNVTCTIDFSDAKVAAALTKTLLLHDFKLKVRIPEEVSYLCPPVPNRVNYTCWISDLVTDGLHCDDLENKLSNKLIADIGVGPLAIYPLLGATLFDMHFIGSDINFEAITLAESNIAENDLTTKITLFLVSDCNEYQTLIASSYLLPLESHHDVIQFSLSKLIFCTDHLNRGPLLTLLAKSHPSSVTLLEECFKRRFLQQELDFIAVPHLLDAAMTNPPFYTSEEAIHVNASTVCTGNDLEMRTSGGEVAFVTAIIADSLVLRESVGWYSCMLGKKSSLRLLRAVLLAEGIPQRNVRDTVFDQGVTRRWGLAWTFAEDLALPGSEETALQTASLHISLSVADLIDSTLPEEAKPPCRSDELFHSDDVLELVLRRLSSCSSDTSIPIPPITSSSSSSTSMERCLHLSVQIDPSTGRPCSKSNNLVIGSVSFTVHLTNTLSLESSCSLTSLIQIDADLTSQNNTALLHFKDYLEQNILRRNRRWKRKLSRLG